MTDFFFAEVSVVPVALLRVLLASIILIDLASLWPKRQLWLGNAGILRDEAWQLDKSNFSLFRYLGSDEKVVDLHCVAHGLLAVSVLFGIGIQVSLPLLFASQLSIYNRNRFILYGGDSLLRLLLLFLCLGPAGASLSFDRWLSQGDLGLGETGPAWPLRLIQLQIAVVYLYTYLHKENSTPWRHGDTVWYVVRNPAYFRRSIPAKLKTVGACRVWTWGALALEFALGSFIWIHETALLLVLAGILFHMVLGWCLSIHLFSWIMIAGLTSFFPAELYLGAYSTDHVFCASIWEWGTIWVFVAFIILWGFPFPTTIGILFRRMMAGPVTWLGLEYGWGMFSGRSPGKLWASARVIVLLPQGGCVEYEWGPEGIRPPSEGFQFDGDHRAQKIREGLLPRNPVLAEGFLSYLEKELASFLGSGGYVAFGVARVCYRLGDPTNDLPEPPPEVLRAAVAMRTGTRKLCGAELEQCLARTAFAWRLSMGGPALIELAETALLAGITMARLGLSPDTALGRLKHLVTRGSRLEDDSLSSFRTLIEFALRPLERLPFLAILEDLRDGRPTESSTNPLLLSVPIVDPAEPWPELTNYDFSSSGSG